MKTVILENMLNVIICIICTSTIFPRQLDNADYYCP